MYRAAEVLIVLRHPLKIGLLLPLLAAAFIWHAAPSRAGSQTIDSASLSIQANVFARKVGGVFRETDLALSASGDALGANGFERDLTLHHTFVKYADKVPGLRAIIGIDATGALSVNGGAK